MTRSGVFNTHCRKGHPLTADTIALRSDRPNSRECRICRGNAIRKRTINPGVGKGGHRRLLTHCSRGHPFSGDNLSLSEGYRRCIACANASSNRSNANANRVTEEKLRSVLGFLHAGDTLSLAARKSSVPSQVVKVFAANHPKIGKRIFMLVDMARQKAFQERNAKRVASPAIMRNDGRDAYAAIFSSTRHLWEGYRREIQSDLWFDVSQGRLALHQVADRVEEYVRKYKRENKHSVMNRGGNLSLDAALNDDGFSLMDVVADGSAWSVPIHTGRRIAIKVRS